MATTATWTIAQMAKPHIIGWRVIRNALRCARSGRARRAAPDCLMKEPTSRIEASHINRLATIHTASPASHS